MKTQITLTRDQFGRIGELLDLDGDAVRTEYSGRGMYGSHCVGFVVNRGDEVAVGVAIATILAEDAGDEDYEDALCDALDIARRANTDSMGHDTIVYFPGVAVDVT